MLEFLGWAALWALVVCIVVPTLMIVGARWFMYWVIRRSAEENDRQLRKGR